MKLFKSFLVLSSLILFGFSAHQVLAQATTTVNLGSGATSTVNLAPIHLDNPLSVDTPQELIGTVINAALGIIGSIALIMFIYGGFIWLTSSGNEQKVTQGRNILMWAAIGLVIIFLSYALVKFVITDLIGAV